MLRNKRVFSVEIATEYLANDGWTARFKIGELYTLEFGRAGSEREAIAGLLTSHGKLIGNSYCDKEGIT